MNTRHIASLGLFISLIAWTYSLPVTCACPPELQSPLVTAGEYTPFLDTDHSDPLVPSFIPGNDIYGYEPVFISNYKNGAYINEPKALITLPRVDITETIEAYEIIQLISNDAFLWRNYEKL